MASGKLGRCCVFLSTGYGHQHRSKQRPAAGSQQRTRRGGIGRRRAVGGVLLLFLLWLGVCGTVPYTAAQRGAHAQCWRDRADASGLHTFSFVVVEEGKAMLFFYFFIFFFSAGKMKILVRKGEEIPGMDSPPLGLYACIYTSMRSSEHHPPVCRNQKPEHLWTIFRCIIH